MGDVAGNGDAERGSSDADLIREAREAARRAREGSSAPDVVPPLSLAPDQFPGYEVVREIHRGGQGVVYQAIQLTTKRKVAIKVMHQGPFASASERRRFEREVEILAQLQHPNIVAVLDSGEVDGSFFYVMEYISGQTLDQYVQRARPDLRSLLELLAKVCDAIHAAHLRGVIHRDIKPSNIRVDSSGEPHIVDFGLARVAGGSSSEGEAAQMTMTGQFIGSLPWASPEQAQGSPDAIDLRSDVYSLGVVAYQMLTGAFPYEVIGNMRDVLDNILRAAPRRPSTINRGINDEIETIVLKCLSKERERRYQTAGEIARDIRRYLAGEAIEAKRDSGWYVLRKAMRRHRTLVGASGVLLLALVAFAIVAGVLWHDAARARDEASRALEREREALADARAQRDRAIEAEAQMREQRDRAQEAEAAALAAREEATRERDAALQARRDAETQAKIAEARLATAEQTRGFLVDAILSAMPAKDLGREVRMVDFLRSAARRIDAAPIDDPVEKAVIRQAIGQALFALGETVQARQELSRAVEVLTLASDGGRDDERTLSAMNDLAIVLRNMGELEQADALLGRCIEKWRARFDAGEGGYRRLLAGLNNQARVLQRRGEHAAALSIYERLVPEMEAAFGPEHVNTLGVRRNRATALIALDRFDEGRRELEEVLAGLRSSLSEDHPLVAASRLDLASAFIGLGDLDRGEALIRSAIASFAKIHPDQAMHQDLRGARFRLARLLIDMDREEEAEAILRALVAGSDDRVAPFDRGVYEAALGWCLLRQGRAAEGEGPLVRGFERMREARGLDDPDVRTVLGRLVRLYDALGEGGEVYRQMLESDGG